jgi:hypothetical protein
VVHGAKRFNAGLDRFRPSAMDALGEEILSHFAEAPGLFEDGRFSANIERP